MCPSLERNSTADLQQWDYVYHLAINMQTTWPRKLRSHASRDPIIQVTCNTSVTCAWHKILTLHIYSSHLTINYHASHMPYMWITSKSHESHMQTSDIIFLVTMLSWYCNQLMNVNSLVYDRPWNGGQYLYTLLSQQHTQYAVMRTDCNTLTHTRWF